MSNSIFHEVSCQFCANRIMLSTQRWPAFYKHSLANESGKKREEFKKQKKEEEKENKPACGREREHW